MWAAGGGATLRLVPTIHGSCGVVCDVGSLGGSNSVTESGLIERLDRIEADLRALAAEVDQVRALAAAGAVELPVEKPSAVAAPSSLVVTETPPELMRQAWRELERGREEKSLALARTALERAVALGDENVRGQVAAFAAAAAGLVGSPLLGQARDLAAQAEQRATPPGWVLQPPEKGAAVTQEREADAVAVPARSARASVVERIGTFAASELSGARAFALAGGVVTLLGIVFLFVLAANRGWIGPVARVSIGAVASAGVLAAGVALRVRYGRLQASLAAVGTGIAGAYATLAAATIIYSFLPEWGALIVAAPIAAAGSTLALRWRSEILAGLSLVGAAAAPGLVALDDGISALGTAFALVVFAAALAVAAPRRWLWLAVAVGTVALSQVVWLTDAAAAEDVGAISVVSAAALVLLGGAIAWQASFREEELDPVAATLALSGGGLALATLVALLPGDAEAGLALACAALVYGAAGYVAGRWWRDLGWVVGAVALLLAGIATSFLLSERSLTVAWAIEAIALAVVAWRLATPRFQLAALAYLALGVSHLLLLDIWVARPAGDFPSSGAVGMYVLAAAALVAGTLAPALRRDRPSVGLLAPLEPLWNGLVSARGSIRFALYGLAVALAAAGTAAVLSGRLLTLAWLAAAVALAVGAFMLGERRLQGAALSLFALAGVHALAVEVQPHTLVLARGLDALAPVPSLAALAAASAILAGLALFSDRGIAFLGPLEGWERSLAWLGVHARPLRSGLLTAAALFAVWAAGLLLIRVSYEPGQVGATVLWAVSGVALAAFAARRRWPALALAAAAPTLFAYAKAAGFDWQELGSGWAATALLLAAAAVLLLGFLARYAAAAVRWPVEFASLACAIVATVSALVAVDHVAPDQMRLLGAAALAVAVLVGALAVPPFIAWRRGMPEPWPRNLATVYWSVALVTLAFAERDLVGGGKGATVALWAASAAVTAAAANPLKEDRLWLAGISESLVAAATCLALVTVPSRLVVSSAHPGTGLWALVVCVASLGWIVSIGPPALRRPRVWIALVSVALAVFALSLGVLEIGERVSGASVATDFQRGQTAVSALWGVLALGLFVVGLLRSERLLQRVGLALFGLSLAKLFLYDLSNLSSITRALSFLAVGALLLAAAFFVERIIHGGGPGGQAGSRTA
jgi:uncharacterized membrane protein